MIETAFCLTIVVAGILFIFWAGISLVSEFFGVYEK